MDPTDPAIAGRHRTLTAPAITMPT